MEVGVFGLLGIPRVSGICVSRPLAAVPPLSVQPLRILQILQREAKAPLVARSCGVDRGRSWGLGFYQGVGNSATSVRFALSFSNRFGFTFTYVRTSLQVPHKTYG